MKKFLREETGSVLIIVVVGMVIFLGITALVLDNGMEYITKSRLQNAVDAAALAGAQGLIVDDGGATATITARYYLDENGVVVPVDGVDNPDADAVSISFNNPDYTQITVSATRDVPFRFASIFGSDDQYRHNNVSATAIAAIYPIVSTTGVLPIGVLESNYALGETVVMWGETGSPGNFGWLDLDPEDHSGGASDVADWIANGYDGQVWVDEEIYSETGKMVEAIQNLNERIGDCHAGCTYGNIEPNCPRLVIIPMIEAWPDNGASETATIVGFAQFLLPAEPVEWEGNEVTFSGTFVGGITSGEINPDQRDFGLKGVRLIQ